MKKINYLILMMIVLVGISCSKPSYEKEYSWAYPVAGDWTVKAYVGGVEGSDPFEMKSYNSSFGKDSIWFDDYATTSTDGNYWSFKFKTAVDMTTKSFSTIGSTNAIEGYRIPIIVTNGKIVGNDSITMDVVFGDDPGTTYQIAGHRTTSYDEYVER